MDVAISERDHVRVDNHFGLFGKYPDSFTTGPEWAKIFIGDPTRVPVFTINSAKLPDEVLAAGFALRVHYIVEGTLRFNGREYPINAEGARATGGMISSAIHEAIQLGIVDAAHKVKWIISSGLTSADVPSTSH